MEQVSVRFLQFHHLFADPWCYHWVTLTQLADVGTVPELQTNGGFRAFLQKSQTSNRLLLLWLIFIIIMFITYYYVHHLWACGTLSILTQSEWIRREGYAKVWIFFFFFRLIPFYLSVQLRLILHHKLDEC